MLNTTRHSLLRHMRHGAKNALHTFSAILNLSELYPSTHDKQGRQAHNRRLLAMACAFDHLRIRQNSAGEEDVVVEVEPQLHSLAKRCQATLACTPPKAPGEDLAVLSIERATALSLYALEESTQMQALRQGPLNMLAVRWQFHSFAGKGVLRIGFPLPAKPGLDELAQQEFSRELIRLTCQTLGASYEREADQSLSVLEFPLGNNRNVSFLDP